MENKVYQIKTKIILTPYEIITDGIITIHNGRIRKVNDRKNKDYFNVDFGKKILIPGLFNAHDHLLGNYFPRIGKGPYINWLPWDNDLKSSPVYTERSKIPPKEIYQLGAYRNLISGVLTVSDHIPHFVNDPYIDHLPIRVIKEYALAHESSDYDLKWGEGIEIEYQKAIRGRMPFITHIEEGYDKEAEHGIDKLKKLNALSRNTILIHAIALSTADIKTIAKNKANIVWCPNSNMFMFNRTGNVRSWIKNNINISIGTDSPMSGGINLLEEVQFAHQTYKDLYHHALDPDLLLQMVTINPAKAFLINEAIGSVQEKKSADLVLLDGDVKNPYQSFLQTKLKDIALIIFKGLPVYGNEEYRPLFKRFDVNVSEIKIDNVKKLIIGDPLSLLARIRKLVGFHKQLPFLPIE